MSYTRYTRCHHLLQLGLSPLDVLDVPLLSSGESRRLLNKLGWCKHHHAHALVLLDQGTFSAILEVNIVQVKVAVRRYDHDLGHCPVASHQTRTTAEREREHTGSVRQRIASRSKASLDMRNPSRAPTSLSALAGDTLPQNAQGSWSLASTFSSKWTLQNNSLATSTTMMTRYSRHARLLLLPLKHRLESTLILLSTIHRLWRTSRTGR